MPIIDDELWERLELLLLQSKAPGAKKPRRKPVSDRAALSGIVVVLRTGLRWCDLPSDLGYGSGVTCWRRLRDWQATGLWDRLHELLLAELRTTGQVD
ncbi:Mobile element protein [Caballeronia sordidicola]|nr:Mobile element protein [Caballeronia sordidicola]